MDVNKYISSGILEEYTLGLVTNQERQEVECMSHIYPEIFQALIAMETEMEKFAQIYSRKTPSNLRARVLSEVKKHKQEGTLKVFASENSDSALKHNAAGIKNSTNRNQKSLFAWAVAAAVAVMAFAAWHLVQNIQKTEELTALHSEHDSLQSQLNKVTAEAMSKSSYLHDFYSLDVRKIILEPKLKNYSSQIALIWNTHSGEVQLDLSALMNLPHDKQYQLWILNDGIPADMGVLPKSHSQDIVVASKAAIEGDAFAITIEDFGGSPSPNLNQLVAIGNVS